MPKHEVSTIYLGGNTLLLYVVLCEKYFSISLQCSYLDMLQGFARKKMMLVHIRKYHMSKDDHVLLADFDDLDDITLDDHLDNESTGSVESGEILGPETGGHSSDMVTKILLQDSLFSRDM